MEEHFLKDFVKGETRATREPWYNPDGDCIVYQIEDEEVVAQRVDEVLTVYNSIVTGKAIGYQIKGIAAIINKFGWEGIRIDAKQDQGEIVEISVSALLLAAYEHGPKTIGRRTAYAEVLEFSSPRIRDDDLTALFPDS